MKLFHVADLHLGKKLLGENLIKEQAYVLDQILSYIQKEKPDGILIAGDIYDKPVPPAEAVVLFAHFLEEVRKTDTLVFAVSGNHDSPERVAYAEGLLKKQGVYLAGIYDGTVKRVELQDEHGSFYVHMLPFLRPAQLKNDKGEPIKTYTDAVRAALETAKIEEGQRNILIAHQFVIAGSWYPQISESEQVRIGELDEVDVSCFDAFDYVALGHLHREQKVGKLTVRYSGSILKYSFQEAGYDKSVTVAEFGGKGDVSIRKLKLEQKTDMAVLKGTMQELFSEKFDKYCENYYVSIKLTDEEILDAPASQLLKRFPGMLEFAVCNSRTAYTQDTESAEAECLKKTPLELFEEFYFFQNGVEPDEDEKELMRQVLCAAGEEEE